MRALTPAEVNMARSVFGSTIFYQSVLVHCDCRKGCRIGTRRLDRMGSRTFAWLYISGQDSEAQHLIIHEIIHIWQPTKGMWVRIKKFLLLFIPLFLRLPNG
ncbi:hypothetical protein D9B83_09320 [Serratia marcescens]|nr:hypothetical protein D9B83_09320 [Serratia marcescens]